MPVDPSRLNPATPLTLSRIILRLLEKEPDRRYQSADGLAFDLARLQRDFQQEFSLGERDFRQRLDPPSGLVGREREVELLHEQFKQALHGGNRIALVSGVPGVGKTALTG